MMAGMVADWQEWGRKLNERKSYVLFDVCYCNSIGFLHDDDDDSLSSFALFSVLFGHSACFHFHLHHHPHRSHHPFLSAEEVTRSDE